METDQINHFKIPVVDWGHGVLQSEEAGKLQCELLSAVQNPQKVIDILASNQYNTYLSKRNESEFCNNFIVVRNKKTNLIRIYEADNFLMLPYRSLMETKTNSQVKKEEKDVVQNASLSLNKAMGSKRNKRMITEIEKGNVHVGDVEKKLKKAIKDNEVVIKEEPEPVSMTNETCLPPCNRNADSVEGVYNLNDLISTEILDNLELISLEVLQTKPLDLSNDKRLSPFFVKTFVQMSRPSQLQVKMLLFIDTLIKFLNAPFRNVKKRDPVFCEYSFALNKKIVNEFCVTLIDGKLNRPPSMRDKALCYMLVLMLLINNFTIDISLFSGQLSSMEYQKLPKLLRAVGAKPEKNSAINYVLKLPLAELSLNNSRRSGNFGTRRR